MRRLTWLFAAVIIMTIASCGSDPAPIVCKPRSLQLFGDSLVFSYNENGKIGEVLYFNILRRMTKRDEFSYNLSGRLVVVQKTIYPITGNSYTEAIHTLAYDTDGRPAKLTSKSPFTGTIDTNFSHDANGRLIEASSSAGPTFLGSTRYEYDDAGNVPRIYYKLNLNQKLVEVLARENLTFDDREKFYSTVEELKILNEYIYSYLPNKNNCLEAKVYYYSYKSRFVTPLVVTFAATYNEQGMISSLGDNPPNTNLYSSEILFERVLYRCD
jgi:RHS Repeat